MIFYFKYIKDNLHLVKHSANRKLFELVCEKQWLTWLGLAFERFIVKYAVYIAEQMGFGDEILSFGSYQKNNCQIDLVYKRSDKTYVICEIKYREDTIKSDIIPELERKISAFSVPRGYSVEKALICVHGASTELVKSEYFNYIVTIDEILP